MSKPEKFAVEQTPESPCRDVCSLDPNGICMGCYRTIDEIVAWGGMEAGARRAVIAELPARRRRLTSDAGSQEDRGNDETI